jgi:Transcriptional regulator, AbiEi antitoxin
VNVTELLQQLGTEHDEAAAHADSLRRQIDDLTAALGEAEARLAELATTRKVVEGIARPEAEPEPTATADSYQAILAAFNDHPQQPFRARELHEFLGLPTDEASVNVTRSRLGRLVRQGVLIQPGRGIYQKRT